MRCPCGSSLAFDACCGPYLRREAKPPTAEALMRARYSAYTQRDLAFIADTFAPETRAEFNEAAARQWASEAQWLKLEIVAVEGGGPEDKTGTVEFIASYRQGGAVVSHHEQSYFRQIEKGDWRFTHGETQFDRGAKTPVVRETAKVGRNDPCPCGSGKKFKKCCGA